MLSLWYFPVRAGSTVVGLLLAGAQAYLFVHVLVPGGDAVVAAIQTVTVAFVGMVMVDGLVEWMTRTRAERTDGGDS